MKRPPRDAGFALAALIFFATAISILIAAAYPSYVIQAKREREIELMFRGAEFTRAIQKYQHKFNVYPPSTDALIQTNGYRFLRRVYKDPITGEDLRIITINPNGTLNNSQVNVLTGNGSGTVNAGLGSGGNSNLGGGTGTAPARSGTGAASGTGATGLGGSSGTGSSGNRSPFGSGNSGGVTGTGVTGSQTASTGNSGIVGVASDSKDAALMVYNGHTNYNEWEFIAIQQPQSATPTQTPSNSQPGTRSGQNTPQNPFGGTPQLGNGAQPGSQNSSPFGISQPSQQQNGR